MHRVVTSKIIRTIFEQRKDTIVHLCLNDSRYVRYNYRRFHKNMRGSEFLIDERTILDRKSLFIEKRII